MWIRFSLRTFFLLLTLLSCFCYIWLTRPSHVAQRLAAAINSEDYQAADQLFLRAEDQFLADLAADRWAFQATCKLRPLSFVQLISARRQADVHISYFEFDSTAGQQVQVAATPFGLNSPAVSSVKYGREFIDRARGSRQSTLER
jgi:hypothetical protein